MEEGYQEVLLRTVARVARALRAGEVPFALTGGCAVYARGGPASSHDVDILVREQDVPAAVSTLVATGMRAADTPLDWLAKVYDGDVLVDLLFRPNQRPVTDDTLARAETVRVGAASLPVVTATDLVVDKLLVFGPHRCDFGEVLPVARALREQIDWLTVAKETAESPFAEAFLLLLDRLDIATRARRE
ncbi:MAG TPA: nucleotidyltransferase family protein [Pseudonocardiaceae bacterium]|nr:nucleotidyltransferase family protein [Pseudonocardiaceae bacterium]